MADIKVALYGADGETKGEIELDAAVFGIEPNMAVLHQVVTAQLAAARSGSASTKTRAEVRGGGRKPWRQKGLGRARHGSIRAPQWTGGGVVFGPRPRSYEQRTPKKMKKLALRSALSARAAEEAIRVVDNFEPWATPRTKDAASLLAALGAGRKSLVVLEHGDTVAERSFRNLPDVRLLRAGHVAAYDVLWADTVVFTTATLRSVGEGGYDVSDTDFVREAPDKIEEGS
ncbi:MAG TPA: 50S ribosomal protein L4 [Acidimicrobiia bacterium]|jgi:large subunit ribosomal protein L4|nr:50S ribosomal protein L4 [Acidimicrobiia bacterium]